MTTSKPLDLHDHHRTMLTEESGIHPDLVSARGYHTVSDAAELKRLGFSPKQQNVPALVIPIFSPTGEVKLYQSRPDAPRLDDKGKPVKYETPAGSRMALDVHPLAKGKLADPHMPLFVTEGIKKGDALVSHGLCAVGLIGVWNWRGTNEQGGKTALPEWEFIALNDRPVYIVFDSDVMSKKEVAGALVRLKAMLEHKGAKVKVIYLPDAENGSKQGVDDYLAAGHSAGDLIGLATSELKGSSGLRPEIEITGRFLRDISDDAKAALLAANDPETLFMRGSIMARVSGEKIEPLTHTTLKSHLDRIADFVKVTYKQGENGKPERVVTPARPPADLAPDLLGRLDLDLPELDEVVNAPVFLPDGSLLAQDGYDHDHKILLKLRGLSGVRADMPIDEALRLLDTVYADFPFTETAGRAHTLALTLERFVRPLIQGATPMYLIDAPARGTGKGLLAEVSNLIPLGYFTPTMSQPRDSDEAEKRITSVLLEARPVVFWDNVTRLGSDPLHAVLTSQVWQGRILGKSETVTVPNRAVWLASGNNVELSDEMTRRIIPIRLDAGVERPEERTSFTIKDLPAYVRGHRSELVSACLSLIRAWVTEGMPKGEATLGRYESWAGVLGGILEVSGVSGFLSGRERLHSEADKETQEWAALLSNWWSTYGERAVTASEIFTVVKEYKMLLDLWAGREGLAASQRFGRALTAKRDRVFGGFKIMGAGRDAVTKSNQYRLTRAPKQTPETPLNPVKPVTDVKDSRGFVRGSESLTPETPVEPPANPVSKNAVLDGVSSPKNGVSGVSGVLNRPAEKREMPSEVQALYKRFKAGELKGAPLKLPGRYIGDLEKALEYYFTKSTLTDAERHDLLEMAKTAAPIFMEAVK